MYVSISGTHWVTRPADKERRWVDWGGETPASPLFLSNKEVTFQWKATINLDTGTQALIDLIPRCPVFSEVSAKKLPLPLYTPTPPLRSGLLVSARHLPRGQKAKCAQKGEAFSVHMLPDFSTRACLQIIWDSSRRGLLLPQISFKNLNHTIRVCQVQTSRRLCWWRKKEDCIASQMERRATLSRERSILYWISCEVLFSIRCIILKTHLTFQAELVWNSHIKKKNKKKNIAEPGGWPLCAHAV